MLKTRLAGAGFFLLVLLAMLCGSNNTGYCDAENEQRTVRYRGGYMGIPNSNVLAGMSAVGMNTVMAKFGDLTVPISCLDNERLKRYSVECALRKLQFMPTINWWGKKDIQSAIDYTPVVNKDGRVLTKTPCPYYKPFWDQRIVPKFLEVVRTLERRPLGGMLLDMEMYGADNSGYHHNPDCYCDNCFTRYMKSKGLSGPLPIYKGRAKTVAAAGDTKYYSDIEQEVAKGLAEDCRAAIHNLRPGLPIGVLHLDQDTPIQRGLALGFGTEERPVLCFSEKSYSNGYTLYIDSAQQKFKAMGAHVEFIPGIWMKKFTPADFSDQLCRCASASAGYWIYTMQSFYIEGYDPPPCTLDEEWDAIKKANQCIEAIGLPKRIKL